MRDRGPSSDEIIADLRARIGDLVSDLYPGHQVKGGIAYCSAKSTKDLGSFQVYLRRVGQFDQGEWIRYSERVGGNPLNLIAYALTGNHRPSSYKDAIAYAKRFLGIVDREETAEEARARQERAKDAAEKKAASDSARARKEAFRQATAQQIWDEAVPIAGTLAERYLLQRGIPKMPWPAQVRFHPAVDFELLHRWDDGKIIERGPDLPCLIARVQAQDNTTCAIWQVFLDEETGRKVSIVDRDGREYSAKIGRGPAAGGAVRLYGNAGAIATCEGIETAFGIIALRDALGEPRLPVWPLLSTSGLGNFEAPKFLKSVVNYPDGDLLRIDGAKLRQAPGIAASLKHKEILVRGGVEARVLPPPNENCPTKKADYLDLSCLVRGVELRGGYTLDTPPERVIVWRK